MGAQSPSGPLQPLGKTSAIRAALQVCGHRLGEQVCDWIHLRRGQSANVPVSTAEKLAQRILLDGDMVENVPGFLPHGLLFGRDWLNR